MKKYLGIALALFAVFSIWQFAHGIELRAKLKFRSDSLAVASAQIDTLQSDRAARELVLVQAIAEANERMVAARSEMGRYRALARANTQRLDSALADAPEPLKLLVNETVGALEGEVRACNLALQNCDQIVAGKDSLLAQVDSTARENRALFVAAQDQLEDAIRAARPSPTRWVERGLALYGLVKIAQGLLVE